DRGGQQLNFYEGISDGIRSIDFSASGEQILASGINGKLRSWDNQTARLYNIFNGHAGDILQAEFTTDDTSIISLGFPSQEGQRELRFWDASSAEQIDHQQTISEEHIVQFAFHPQEKILFLLRTASLEAYSLEEGLTHMQTYELPFSPFNGFAISPDGRDAALITGNDIQILDLEKAEVFRSLQPNASDIAWTHIHYSPDGRYILAGSIEGRLEMWDVNNGQSVRTFEGHHATITAIDFLSNGGDYFLSASVDGTLRAWELLSGKELSELTGVDPFQRIKPSLQPPQYESNIPVQEVVGKGISNIAQQRSETTPIDEISSQLGDFESKLGESEGENIYSDPFQSNEPRRPRNRPRFKRLRQARLHRPLNEPGTAYRFSSFHPDLVNEKDQLNITPDVNAFSNLISSRELKPPLSIGLFGDWGSGKSFFMGKMRKRVNANVEWVKQELKTAGEKALKEIQDKSASEVQQFIEGLLPDTDPQFKQIMTWFSRRDPSAINSLNKIIGEKKTEALLLKMRQDPQIATETIKKILADNQQQQLADLSQAIARGEVDALNTFRRLVEVKKESELGYCKNISQIEFNAWHYIDTNLWASLITNIFEDLNTYVGNVSQEVKDELELYKNLATTQDLLRAEEARKDQLDEEMKGLQKTLASLEEERTDLRKELKDVGIKEIWTVLSQQEDVKDTHKKIKENLTEARKQLGIDEAMEARDELMADVASLQGYYEETKIRSRLTTWFNEFKKMGQKSKWFLIIFIVVPLVAMILGPLIPDSTDSWLSGSLVEAASKVIAVIFALLKILPNAIEAAREALSKINKGVAYLESARTQLGQLQDLASTKLDLELARKKEELSRKAEEIIATKASIQALESDFKSIEAEIQAIQEGKRLSAFIEKRLSSNEYQRHLGLISVIREDFEKLASYLQDREYLSRILSRKEEKEEGPFQLEKVSKIDRIILYIDDLDRCPPEKVVEVLQAVHLILAFPLFVVVVGVDVRWISKSLIKQYGSMLAPIQSSGIVSGASINEQAEKSLQYSENATPFDYLEKIFQIPFRLVDMDDFGKKRYINHLLDGDMEKAQKVSLPPKKTEPNTAPPPSESPEQETSSLQQDKPAEDKSVKTSTPPESETPVVPVSEEVTKEKTQKKRKKTTRKSSIPTQNPPVEDSEQDTKQQQEQPLIVEKEKRKRVLAKAINTPEKSMPLPAEELPMSPQQAAYAAIPEEVITQALEKISLAQNELSFITSLTPILDSSPRTIKRFVNVCRLIKSHSQWGAHGTVDESQLDAYQSLVFALAIITGIPDFAQLFFELIDQEEEDISVGEFIENRQYQVEDALKISRNETARNQWYAFEQVFYPEATAEGEQAEIANYILERLRNLKISTLRQQAEIALRFSFRFRRY
ncbi:MAG: P-loop NTPase fold protein, partial [Bacteroidota bacterium]